MREELVNRDQLLFPSPVSSPVIRTLLYFDIFHYPLKLAEIRKFLNQKSDERELAQILDPLITAGYIHRLEGYYGIVPGRENINRRIAGNAKAGEMLPVAKRRADLIGKFPFVRAVMASGSLSKGYMDDRSDLDFFIVTAPGRLWVARMLLVLYKRLFLGNSSKKFCVNYFISENHLEIDEKNLFTATELATVIPLFAPNYYLQLIGSNSWVYQFFPNFAPATVIHKDEKKSYRKKLTERILDLCGGNYLDSFCLWLTKRRWARLYTNHYSRSDFDIAFKSRKDVSKGHPKNYQKKVMEMLEEKWESYVNTFGGDQL
jgi:hypothetical protein